MEAKGLGEVGSFCPHETCRAYGEVGAGNIIAYGKSRQGVQRYFCKSCERAFNANYGTLFYRRRKSAAEIIETLALLAKGTSLSAVVAAKGYKEETVQSWLEEAATHAEAVSTALLRDYDVSAAQIDGLWSFVAHKGSKKGAKKVQLREPSGAAPCSS